MTEIKLAPEGAKRTRDSITGELTTIIDDLLYDISHLPYKVMLDEPCGRAIYDNYERLTRFMQKYRGDI